MTDTTIRFDRLQTLAQFMKDLPEEAVDLERWMSDCGTLGCLLGWACSIPEFKAAGLGLSLNDGWVEPTYRVEGCMYPFAGSSAGRKFFGLPQPYNYPYEEIPTASYLFSSRRCCPWDEEPGADGLNDRDLALYRLRRLFEEHNRELVLA